jgi:exodeoxyribonuclease VII large subunit
MNGKKILTVSQLSRYLKFLLQSDSILQNICISGEISNFKLHKPSGHMYFTLKDEKSVLRCIFFRNKNLRLKFLPGEGMKVLARGDISVYEYGGYYQLYIDRMEPDGLGTLFLAFEQLKEKLRLQGLFDPQHKRPLPFIPRKIGLITSPSGAAVKDFLRTLLRRFPCVQVFFCPSAVQGSEAAFQLITALERLQDIPDLDVIVLTRGGGSLEELWTFNDEKLARAIFECKIPVISAVGHETDFTIADFVADMRVATPTAAAEQVAPELRELLQKLQGIRERLLNLWDYTYKRNRADLERFSDTLFLKFPRDKINQGYQRIDDMEKLFNRIFNIQLKLKNTRLEHLKEKIEALNPLKVMDRGFVFVLGGERELISDIKQLKVGNGINIIFKNGEAGCRVENLDGNGLLPSGNEG